MGNNIKTIEFENFLVSKKDMLEGLKSIKTGRSSNEPLSLPSKVIEIPDRKVFLYIGCIKKLVSMMLYGKLSTKCEMLDMNESQYYEVPSKGEAFIFDPDERYGGLEKIMKMSDLDALSAQIKLNKPLKKIKPRQANYDKKPTLSDIVYELEIRGKTVLADKLQEKIQDIKEEI